MLANIFFKSPVKSGAAVESYLVGNAFNRKVMVRRKKLLCFADSSFIDQVIKGFSQFAGNNF